MKLLYIGIIAQVIYWTLLIVLWSSFANASSFRGLNEIVIAKRFLVIQEQVVLIAFVQQNVYFM